MFSAKLFGTPKKCCICAFLFSCCGLVLQEALVLHTGSVPTYAVREKYKFPQLSVVI